MKKYVFVIKTNEYAGNFEREMCAYLTGMTGDCGVGQEFADLYLREMDEEESIFEEFIEQRSDDGCARPCSIWEGEGAGGNDCNAVAIFFETKPTADMIRIMKERAEKFAEAKRTNGQDWDKNFKLKIKGFYLVEESTKAKSTKL